METTFEIIIGISTVLFHVLSAAVLILMIRTMMKEDKAGIKNINQGGGTQNGGAENPSQQTE